MHPLITHSVHILCPATPKIKKGKPAVKSETPKEKVSSHLVFFLFSNAALELPVEESDLLTILALLCFGCSQRPSKRKKVKNMSRNQRNQKPRLKLRLWLLDETIQTLTAVWM